MNAINLLYYAIKSRSRFPEKRNFVVANVSISRYHPVIDLFIHPLIQLHITRAPFTPIPTLTFLLQKPHNSPNPTRPEPTPRITHKNRLIPTPQLLSKLTLISQLKLLINSLIRPLQRLNLRLPQIPPSFKMTHRSCPKCNLSCIRILC